MKRILLHGVLVLSLALCASPAALAAGKHKKYSPAHYAAIKKCKEDYSAVIKAANALKGRERTDAKAKAKADEMQCIASAPK